MCEVNFESYGMTVEAARMSWNATEVSPGIGLNQHKLEVEFVEKEVGYQTGGKKIESQFSR